MKLNKVLFFLFFPLVAEILYSCTCTCPEEFNVKGKYSNTGIKLENVDNSTFQKTITKANSIQKNYYGINVSLSREKTACLSPKRSLFIPSALACDCQPGQQLFAKDSIESIQFLTVNDFDEKHKANSDISDYFKVFSTSTPGKISDVITSSYDFMYEFELEFSFVILLETPPTLNQKHQFKIKIILSDGRILEGMTTAVDLI
jgi:hypothetical protein